MTVEHGRRRAGKWQCESCRRESRRQRRARAITPGWILAEVLAWAAAELDAQADAHGQIGLLSDYSDHLRCFTKQPERVSAVSWPEGLARPVADAGESGPERPRTR